MLIHNFCVTCMKALRPDSFDDEEEGKIAAPILYRSQTSQYTAIAGQTSKIWPHFDKGSVPLVSSGAGDSMTRKIRCNIPPLHAQLANESR